MPTFSIGINLKKYESEPGRFSGFHLCLPPPAPPYMLSPGWLKLTSESSSVGESVVGFPKLSEPGMPWAKSSQEKSSSDA